VDTDDTGISFKEKLYKKTKIPICRQKIIGFKKGLLLNDTVLRDAGLKNVILFSVNIKYKKIKHCSLFFVENKRTFA
jgi:hypothetical protein